MTNSRALVAAPLLALSLLALASCSGDDEADGGISPTTMACRTYLLEVGGQDTVAGQLLSKAAQSGSWTNDTVNAALQAVATAAKDAGLVEGLPDEDFATYQALSDATAEAYVRANPHGGEGITTETATDFRGAAADARSACTPDD